MKDEEIAKVNRIRQDVEAELEDLTASLFQVSYYVLCIILWDTVIFIILMIYILIDFCVL